MTRDVLPLLMAKTASGLIGGVHCVDALTLMNWIYQAGLKVDAIITDLPYNVGKAEWDYSFPTHWIKAAWRITNRMLIMPGNMGMINAANAVGNYKDCIVMHARNGMTRSPIAFGNWFPVLVFGDWNWKPRPNHISFNVSITEEINHPSPKPLQAMNKLIQYYTEPDDLILDPFAGSGTTALAARQLNRRFIVGDSSPEYCALMERRLAQGFTIPMFETLPLESPA